MKRIMIVATIVGLLGALAAPVSASSAETYVESRARSAGVVITADVSLPEPFEGPFEASGAAVRRGIVCPSGELLGALTGPGSSFYDFTVNHVFTCDDGTGTFSIDLAVRLFDSGGTFFVWSVAGGTGAYGGLTGSGFGVGVPDVPDASVMDYYLGRVRS